MTKPTSVSEFFKRFPDDDACLKHLFDVRFGQGHVCPKCKREARWYPIKAERALSCQWCGHHIHPTVGTLFEKSSTPLQLWFYAIFLFTTTRYGVSGKELQRQLGVTYKTAWRMAKMIHEHMAEIDGEEPFGGFGPDVEVDKTLVGGKKRSRGTYIWVSPNYLETYAKEFGYRFNRRDCAETMLSELLSTFAKPGA